MSDYTVLISTDFPPDGGGIATYLWNIYARGEMDRMAIVVPARPGSEVFDAAQPYAAHRIAARTWPPVLRSASYLWRSYWATRKVVSCESHVVLHCGHIHAAFVAARLKARHATPYLVWTYALELTDQFKARWIRQALRNADLLSLA